MYQLSVCFCSVFTMEKCCFVLLYSAIRCFRCSCSFCFLVAIRRGTQHYVLFGGRIVQWLCISFSSAEQFRSDICVLCLALCSVLAIVAVLWQCACCFRFVFFCQNAVWPPDQSSADFQTGRDSSLFSRW